MVVIMAVADCVGIRDDGDGYRVEIGDAAKTEEEAPTPNLEGTRSLILRRRLE